MLILDACNLLAYMQLLKLNAKFYLSMLQLQAAKASVTERSSYEASRQNELQKRCNKYEQYAEQYRTQRVCCSTYWEH